MYANINFVCARDDRQFHHFNWPIFVMSLIAEVELKSRAEIGHYLWINRCIHILQWRKIEF